MIKTLAQLTLTIARTVATHSTVLMKVTTFQKDKHDMASLVKATTTRYNNTTKRLSQEEKATMSPPHLFVFSTVIKSMKEFMTKIGSAEAMAAKVKLQTFTDQQMEFAKQELQVKNPQQAAEAKNINTEAMRQLELSCKYIKVTQCWNSAILKIETIAIPDTPVQAVLDLVHLLLVQHAGGQARPSVAPKGKLERKVASWLAAKE